MSWRIMSLVLNLKLKLPTPTKKNKRINNLERKDVYILFVKGQKTLSTP